MPELPEVECVRLSLERRVVGRRVVSVRVDRPDVITGLCEDSSLLVGDRVSGVLRHGKQLAMVGERGGCMSVHLGMSGQLCMAGVFDGARTPKQRTTGRLGSAVIQAMPAHTHILWLFDDGQLLRFTDPRRFGGLWTFADVDAMIKQRWSRLGPDALRITPGQLAQGLSSTKRSLKAALLDQHLVAGLGNIYIDELLFNAKLHPLLAANVLQAAQVPGLTRRMKTLLTVAIARGGSTLRDYVDADNERGTQQSRHRVYGRAGLSCKRRGCGGTIYSEQVAGRTTAWCPRCQRLGADG